MKRKKVQPKLVAQQAVNIGMDANPAYITTNGEYRVDMNSCILSDTPANATNCTTHIIII